MRAQISQPVRQLQPSTGQNARLVDAQEVALRHAEVRRTHLQDMWRAVGSTRQRQCESEQCITSMQQLFTQAAGLESLLREKLVAWACVRSSELSRSPSFWLSVRGGCHVGSGGLSRPGRRMFGTLSWCVVLGTCI
eukprot:1604103-Rhodomonas_salina.4